MTKQGIELDTPEMRRFCEKWKIRQLWVFGSILRDDFRPDSDVDFLADFGKDAEWDAFDHMDMESELEAMLGRKVELVGRTAIEAGGNRYRKKEIFAKAEPVIAQR
jgi:predicted nucleotidyltransferase